MFDSISSSFDRIFRSVFLHLMSVCYWPVFAFDVPEKRLILRRTRLVLFGVFFCDVQRSTVRRLGSTVAKTTVLNAIEARLQSAFLFSISSASWRRNKRLFGVFKFPEKQYPNQKTALILPLACRFQHVQYSVVSVVDSPVVAD